MSTKTQDLNKAERIDPKEAGPKPPFEEPRQSPPGEERNMAEKPDHGEQSYRGSNRLVGKKALITGADSGIGRAVAIAFAREGADVLISYLNEDADAEEAARVVKEAGRKAITVPGDIGDEKHCKQLVDRAFDEFGNLDILVNNAAFQMTHENIEESALKNGITHSARTSTRCSFWRRRRCPEWRKADPSSIRRRSRHIIPVPRCLHTPPQRAPL